LHGQTIEVTLFDRQPFLRSTQEGAASAAVSTQRVRKNYDLTRVVALHTRINDEGEDLRLLGTSPPALIACGPSILSWRLFYSPA
jgi:hypothetical protein